MTKIKTWSYSANRSIARALKTLKVLPPMPLPLWAAENFYMSAESSYVEGKWVSYPYQLGVLFAFGHDDIEEVDVRKSARTGYTKMLLAASAYFTIFKRRNQAIWQPTDSDSVEFVQTEYDTMIRDVKAFKPIFPAMDKKHPHNKNDFKKYLGCLTYLKGGTSAKNYRRISPSVGMIDEASAFDNDIDNEGSSRKLVKKRLEGATFPKLIIGSTPKTKYTCEISKAIEEAAAIYKFNIPCPHCDAYQHLEFGGKNTKHGLKWIDNNPETAAYACLHCSALFTQADYLKIWDKGIWIDAAGNWIDTKDWCFRNNQDQEIPPQKHIAFDKMWTLYSPQTDWQTIAKEFLDATKKAKFGEKSDLKTFINTTLGEEYEEEVEKTDASELRQRAEDFALEVVPMGGLMLKAAIDIQKDRFELLVWAIGEGEEMWTVDYKIIEANPTIQSDFDKLDQYLLRSYQHISGTQLYIDEFALDTGNWTQQAYQYVRSRKKIQNWIGLNPNQHPPKAFGTKGVGTAGKPLSSKPTLQDISTYDRVIKQGLKLYSIGTETGKTLFYNRLQVTQAGPGFVHLSKYLPDEFFQHITNEVRVLKHTKKGKVYSWEMRRAGARNECLDCSVMVLFLNSRAGLHNKTKSYWANLRNIVQPNQVDLFAVDSAISHSLPVDIEKKLIKPIQPHSTHNKTGFKEVAAPW